MNIPETVDRRRKENTMTNRKRTNSDLQTSTQTFRLSSTNIKKQIKKKHRE